MARRKPSPTDHFTATIGALPDSVALLRDHLPATFEAYLGARQAAYRAPPAGALPLPTKELLFIVLDVVARHPDGAKAHVAAGLKAGLTVAQIAEALSIAILIFGHHVWGTCGADALAHAVALSKPAGRPRRARRPAA